MVWDGKLLQFHLLQEWNSLNSIPSFLLQLPQDQDSNGAGYFSPGIAEPFG